jgi:hypothetical protein
MARKHCVAQQGACPQERKNGEIKVEERAKGRWMYPQFPRNQTAN